MLLVKTQNATVLGGDTYFKERPIVSSSSENFTLKSGQDSVFFESIDVEIEELCEPHPYCLKISWSPHPVPGPSPVML